MKKFCQRYKRRVLKAFLEIKPTVIYEENENGYHEDKFITAIQLILLGFLALIGSPVLLIVFGVILPIRCFFKDDVEKKENNFDSSEIDQKSHWCY